MPLRAMPFHGIVCSQQVIVLTKALTCSKGGAGWAVSYEETVAHLDERRRLEARGLEVHARHDVVLGAGGGDGFERLDV